MKYLIPSIAIGLLPVPLLAQDALPEPDPIEFANPERNLDCAVFVLHVAQRFGAEEEEKTAAAAAMFMYFVGRYEGSTDAYIEDALVERTQNVEADDMAQISMKCLPELAALTVKLKGYKQMFSGQQEDAANSHPKGD